MRKNKVKKKKSEELEVSWLPQRVGEFGGEMSSDNLGKNWARGVT